MIKLFYLGLDFSINYLKYLKDSVFSLVLRTTWVRLRPVLVLTGIYFAFLVHLLIMWLHLVTLNICTY